jgi:hypothetical protein
MKLSKAPAIFEFWDALQFASNLRFLAYRLLNPFVSQTDDDRDSDRQSQNQEKNANLLKNFEYSNHNRPNDRRHSRNIESKS